MFILFLDLENYRVLHKKARIYWNTSFGRLKLQFLNMGGGLVKGMKGYIIIERKDIIIFSFILDRNIILVSLTPLTPLTTIGLFFQAELN
ncbi:unnamed protein product [Rhizophagus irregularis]|nr:unnamed protein product [Rhizophagus irregularis]